MNIISSYIQELLTKKRYTENSRDTKQFTHNKLDYIFRKLTRKKFRKYSLAPETVTLVKDKINNSIENKKPIKLVIPFGGYKHFWNSSYPYPDFAELFHLIAMQEYLAPISHLYEYGVEFEYISEDLILPYMNNYPEGDLDLYSREFVKLLDFVKPYLNSNTSIKYFRVGEKYDKQKIINEILELYPKRRKEFDKFTEEEKKVELHRSARSIFWNGAEDFTGLSEQDKQEKIIRSRVLEILYYDTEAKEEHLGDYLVSDNHICLCFSFGLSPDNIDHCLTVASTATSIVDFWIGTGILREKRKKFTPTIVSKNQFADLQGIKYEQTGLNLEGLKEIPIVPS